MKKTIVIISAFMLLLGADSFAQWNYGSPISTSAPQSTWYQVVNRPPFNELFDSLTFPYPTNAWFNLLFLGQQTFPLPIGSLGANKCNPYPYQIGLGSGYPAHANYKALLSINYKPFQVTLDNDTAPAVIWDAGNFFYMGTSEPVNIKPSLLNDYTDLSCTIKFVNTTNTSRYYYAPIVRGMPYVTMFYNTTKPGVFFPSPAIVSVNDTTVVAGMNFTNRVFKIVTGGPPNTANRPQTWILFSQNPITLQFSITPGIEGLIAPSDYTGWLRIAHVTYQGENVTQQDITNKINMLTAYSKFIPVRGVVSASYTSGTTASMQFTFTRYNEGSFTTDSLLMMSLPHHQDILSNPTTNILKYAVLKGAMKEVGQKVWNMTENMMPDYTFYPKYGKLASVPLQWCDTLKNYVNGDFSLYFNRNSLAADIYGQGKIFQKLARVIDISDELYERDSVRYSTMAALSSRMRDSLKLFLGHFLDGGHTMNPVHGPGAWDSVFYDTKYGGLISSLGWDSLNVNCCFSYGSAVYNDHHFHYGYSVYAAAIIAKKDPAWFTANGNHYLSRVNDLIRDYGNPSRSDGYYGMMRYKDWFDGNSWANGLVPFGDGKNQESSSEAVNAWYGMYLFGAAMNDNNIKNTGALCLATEIRAAMKYYHVIPPNTQIPSFYTNRYHITGNLFQTKLDAHLFFPPASNFVRHGIQIIPVTPATEQLWDYNSSRDNYDYSPNGLRFSEAFSASNTSTLVWNWTSIDVGVQAVAYPNDALSFFPHYGYQWFNFDNGTSAANVMYWILTRLYGPIGINPISTQIPGKYHLYQNYPNPFNPKASIRFDIARSTRVRLTVYDLLGKEIGKLVDEDMGPGEYRVNWDASNYASGVYFYTLQTDDFTQSKKMILAK